MNIPKERFAFLIAAPRSGTNYLRSMLRSASSFYDCGEVTDEIGIDKPLAYPNFNYFSFMRQKCSQDFRFNYPLPEDVHKLLDEYLGFIDSSIADPAVTIVLDVKYSSIHNFNGRWHSPVEPPNLLRYLAARNLPVLHLIRQNPLRVYVSEVFASKTGQWLIEDGSEPIQARLSIDIPKMLSRINVLQGEIAYYRREFQALPKVEEIYYQDLSANRLCIDSTARQRIEAMFGVQFPPRLRAHVRKIIKDIRVVIANFSEVEAALRRDGLLEMLNDALDESS